jgi:ACS family tartrate transporter-like MFS transporter
MATTETATLFVDGLAVSRKIARRLLPFLFILYITAFIDRVNVGFAGLQMTRELHFSNEVFGFGAGIFFFGYCLLEIPGAVLAERWSARKWISSIMVVWGVLASITGLIQSAGQFHTIRFLLGLAEGGFFPAVVVYLTHWFRQSDRAKAIALFMAAIPVSNAAGAPIAGFLLRFNWLGLSGWRWLLILEGIPAFLGGIVTLFYLTDRPQDARWLAPAECAWITGELEREAAEKRSHRGGHLHILQAFRQPLVLALALSYFLINTTGYGLNIWLPKMVQAFHGLTTFQVSLVAAIPPAFGVPAMLLCGWHSDRTNERKWHAAIAAIAAGIGLGLSQTVSNPVLIVAGFSVAVMGVMSYYPPYWVLPTRMLTATTAAASFGFINLIANLGGFAGPYMVGFLTDRTGTYLAGVLLLVATAILAGAVLTTLREA